MDKVVIVCKHVLDDPSCVKCAFKTESTEPSDSGWQFLCGAEIHTEEDAKVVYEDEIKQLIPSISQIWEAQDSAMFVLEDNKWVCRKE